MGARHRAARRRPSRILSGHGYHNYGDPWQEQRYGATDLAGRAGRRAGRRDPERAHASRWRSPAGPATGPASTSTCASRQRTATRPSAATRSPPRQTESGSPSRWSAWTTGRYLLIWSTSCAPAMRSSCAGRSGLVRLGAGPGGSAAARCRRQRGGAADGDAARPGGRRQRRASAPAAVIALLRRGDLRRRARRHGRPARRPGGGPHPHPLSAAGLGGLRAAHRRGDARRGRLPGGAAPPLLRLRPHRTGGGRPRPWSSSATPPAASRPSASARWGGS